MKRKSKHVDESKQYVLGSDVESGNSYYTARGGGGRRELFNNTTRRPSYLLRRQVLRARIDSGADYDDCATEATVAELDHHHRHHYYYHHQRYKETQFHYHNQSHHQYSVGHGCDIVSSTARKEKGGLKSYWKNLRSGRKRSRKQHENGNIMMSSHEPVNKKKRNSLFGSIQDNLPDFITEEDLELRPGQKPSTTSSSPLPDHETTYFWLSNLAIQIYSIILLAGVCQQWFILYGILLLILLRMSMITSSWFSFFVESRDYVQVKEFIAFLIKYGKEETRKTVEGGAFRRWYEAMSLRVAQRAHRSLVPQLMRGHMSQVNNRILKEAREVLERTEKMRVRVQGELGI